MHVLLEIGDVSRWSLALDIMTLVTGAVGVIALIVAWRSYSTSSAAARDAHMHALFREYLHNRHGGQTFGGADELPETAVSVRLYVLEEMHAWARSERKLAWVRVPFWRLGKRQRLIDSWEETMLVHASYDMVAAVENIRDYRQCYGEDFLVFLRDNLITERVLVTWSGAHFRGGQALEKMYWRARQRFLARHVDAERELREVVESEIERRRSPFSYFRYRQARRLRSVWRSAQARLRGSSADEIPFARPRSKLYVPATLGSWLEMLRESREAQSTASNGGEPSV